MRNSRTGIKRMICRCLFPLLMILTGVVYFTCIDHWQFYRGVEQKLENIAGKMVAFIGIGEHTDESGQDVQTEQEQAWTDGMDAGTPLAQDTDEGPIEGMQSAEDENPKEESEPQFNHVDESYFEDALFIGDSRTVGLYKYGALEEYATFCGSTGMTIFKLFDTDISQTRPNRDKKTVRDILQEKQYGKIYIMVGINEMGVGTVDTFIEAYSQVLDTLEELQPDAIIYVQGIMKVSDKRSRKGDYITNDGIEERNQALSSLADGQRIFYLDVNPLVCGEDGGLVPEYASDGVHLKAQYVEIWTGYLMEHGVEKPLNQGETGENLS